MLHCNKQAWRAEFPGICGTGALGRARRHPHLLRMLPIMLAALAAEAGLAILLAGRQMRAVRRHRDAVPPDFAGSVDLAAHRKAADYTTARLRPAIAQTILGLVAAGLWVSGGLDLLHDAVARVLVPGIVRSVALVLAFGLVGEALAVPFRLLRTFGIERRFGFNRTTPARYALDLAKGTALSLLVGVPLLAGAFWLMRHASGLWWLYAWAVFTAISLALGQAFPRWIAPLFNRFTPLEGELRDRLAALLARCGFEADGLFVMDASRRSAHGNAYFTGLGRSKRIVLFDTLVARHDAQEIEAVLAHELGHFRHGHVLWGMARMAGVSLAAFFCFGVLARGPWLTASLGLHACDDALSLIVFMLWLGAVGPLLGLVSNWFSRRAEFQADAYARATVGAEPLVRALVRLTRDSAGTLTPDPWFALFEYSHPPVPLRVAELRR